MKDSLEEDTKIDQMDQDLIRAQQEARTKLRESFLKAIGALNGQPCNILTYEKTTLKATFAGWKPDGSDILVHNLKTPAHISMQSALLRTSDVLSIQFESSVSLP